MTVTDVEGELTAFLTTIGAAEFAPIDVVSIYTLRWLIEILFRELKQYLHVQQFNSTTLNSALFESFSTWIVYLLVQWFRYRHPLGGGVRATIRFLQVKWSRSLPEYGCGRIAAASPMASDSARDDPSREVSARRDGRVPR